MEKIDECYQKHCELMITVSDLQNLITKWQERVNNPSQPFAYKNGIGECIYDLNQLISRSIQEELTYEDFLSMEADSYLSTMEAHEAVA